MPSSTAVSLAASPNQIAPEMVALLHESYITLMTRSGERYSEERRPLLLSRRVQEVSARSSAAVPDQRVVSCADSTQNSVCPCLLGGARPQLRILGRRSRLPSNATVMPTCTQKTPDLHSSARLQFAAFHWYSSCLVLLLYLRADLPIFSISASNISAASPILHHILG